MDGNDYNELEPIYTITPRFDGDDDAEIQKQNFDAALVEFLMKSMKDLTIRSFKLSDNSGTLKPIEETT